MVLLSILKIIMTKTDANAKNHKIKKKNLFFFCSSTNNATKLNFMEFVHFDVVGKLETSYNDFNYLCYHSR